MSDEKVIKKLAGIFASTPAEESQATSKYVGGKLDIDQYNELCRRLGVEAASGGGAAFRKLLEQWWMATNQKD